jgi:hypothetical protein
MLRLRGAYLAASRWEDCGKRRYSQLKDGRNEDDGSSRTVEHSSTKLRQHIKDGIHYHAKLPTA